MKRKKTLTSEEIRQKKGWIYDGNGRPTKCPLMEVDDAQAESEVEK